MDIEQRLKNVEGFLKNKIVGNFNENKTSLSKINLILIVILIISAILFYGKICIISEKMSWCESQVLEYREVNHGKK